MLYDIIDVVKQMEFIQPVVKRDDCEIKTLSNKKLTVTMSIIRNYKKIKITKIFVR